MKLTLVYHVSKNIKYLKQSLDAIFEQSDMNFNFLLVDDNSSNAVATILNNYDFKKIKSFHVISFNETLSHSYCLKSALKFVKTDYIFYLGSNIILNNDFVETINSTITKNNNLDFILFKKTSLNEQIKIFDVNDVSLYQLVYPTIKNIVFSSKILKKIDNVLTPFTYYPLVLIFEYVNYAKKVCYINNDLFKKKENVSFTYGIYSFISEANYLLANNKKYWLAKNDYELFEFIIIQSVLITFFRKLLWIIHNKKLVNRHIENISKWVEDNISNWKKNKYINQNKKLHQDTKQTEYLSKFKFSYSYIKKYFDNEKK